jgi:hypothetical protein
MTNFRQMLVEQRWDDHRFYHHSLVNQSLHFFSAVTFLVGYLLLFVDPALAALLGWTVAMVSRQAGHFFFEPKGYDAVNDVTHEYKEEIKVGYNLRRKVILHAVWAASPLLLVADPTLFGLFEPHAGPAEFWRHVGWIWLVVGCGGLLLRAAYLCVDRDPMTGIVWMSKILTDPLNDIRLYHAAPLRLLRGERLERAG